ncbi:arsinothricin resistance N-acetyltransferase ArsN1 family A [Paenibacillus thailandensis]|uniref:Arsinothricin resistance N-acetyltransferase ArsN1 family A n=1 Tax=Paenibacillus thailandensis TaxID=393250 RepID=A0ABW5QRS6_9BACL
MNIEIRKATVQDAAALTEIYNYNIVHERNSTFETEPRTLESRIEWIQSAGSHYPILVAHHGREVVGSAYVSAYRARECYKGVGEFSIYLHKDYRGMGIGKQLLSALIEECKTLGYWKLLSRIFDFNTGSRQLCRSLGFREVGIYEKHGQLDGKWLNCVIVEKLLIDP